MLHELDPGERARVVDNLVARPHDALHRLDELEMELGVEIELVAAEP
jgi:FeoA-like protein